MRAPVGRRWPLVLAAGLLLVGACSPMGDLGGELDEAAPPSTPGGGPGSTPSTGPAGSVPTAPGGGAAAPAGPVDDIELSRGQEGTVELDDGARLTVPAGAVVDERARVRLARSGPGSYEPSIQGNWQGRADLRLPLGPLAPPSSAYLLTQSGAGWSVHEAEARPEGFLYAGLTSLSPARVLTCPAAVATDPAGVLACLTQAQVTQLPAPLQSQLGAALGCGRPWPATSLVSRAAACASAPAQQGTVPPSTAPPAPAGPTDAVPSPAAEPQGGAGPLTWGSTGSGADPPFTVTLTENPVACDGSRRPFGVVSDADPGETLTFRAAGIGELQPGEANGSGQVTVHWRCDPSDVGQTWALEAAGESSGRTANFTITGGPPIVGAPAAAGPLQVALLGPTFACDGSRRPAGTLSGAQPGERVTFSAPGLGPLLPGTADAAGRLTVHWRCDATHVGWTWTLQAVGESSGRAGTFWLVGA